MHFFEKYIRIKIENQKILILMSKLSPKLDELKRKLSLWIYNSILWDFHVVHRIASIYHIIMQFFEKYVRIKIDDNEKFKQFKSI